MTKTNVDFLEQLRRHLKFIQASCRAYDQGDHEEALRIAVSLRVLFHDTSKSTSLLTHLGLKDSVHLISTFGLGKTNEELGDKVIFSVPLMLTLDGVRPLLGEAGSGRLASSSSWWNEIVMAQNKRFSRRDIVLSAANQDGGAHVDSDLSLRTIELKEGVGTFTRYIGDIAVSEELENHHFPMIRQMGYEVLNSNELVGLI